MAHRILIVEDNADLAAGIKYNLELEGYDVRVAEDGRSAIATSKDWEPERVLLDLMLPGVDGYQVLQAIRGGGNRVPVIILSARGEESDKVRGFRLDADQYVTKPFGILELLERIAAPARACATAARAVRVGVRRGLDRPRLTRDRARGRSIALTPKAYELLLALVQRDGVVASRADLLRKCGVRGVHHDTHRGFTHCRVAAEAG
jgi:DNA-binding response OmpR family regulator